MWNYGKKIRALRDKKINILTLVFSEKKVLNETKNHNPPFKLNGRYLRCNWKTSMKNKLSNDRKLFYLEIDNQED